MESIKGRINFLPLYCFFSLNCDANHSIFTLMSDESLIEDIVIKSYLELYLRSLNESRSYKFIQTIKRRMVELIKRKQAKPQ